MLLVVSEVEQETLYYNGTTNTGGEGQFTQQVHCEFVVGFETIRPAHTQQVSREHFQKVPTNSPSPNPAGHLKYPPICPAKCLAGKSWSFLKSACQFAQFIPAGKWWALSKSTQHNTQWVLFEQTLFILWQSAGKVSTKYPGGTL